MTTVTSLLTTKLFVPLPHSNLVLRPRLFKRLDEGLRQGHRLILVSAPAGFGKTTLLSQWVSIHGAENAPKQVAWVSLENECDLRRFWTYITTALSEIQPGIGKSAFALFDAPQPNFHAIVRTLINEIADEAKEFLLILDDYHHIDNQEIHGFISALIEHLPANIHLILSTRVDPPLRLARLRVPVQTCGLSVPVR